MLHDSILTNPSEKDLETAVSNNLYALFKAMVSSLPQGELIERDDLSCHFTFPINPMFKGVWRTRLSEDQLSRAITETIQWFKSRNAPYFFWWIDSDATPNNLDEHLAENGLLSMDEGSAEFSPGIVSTRKGAPVMIADLHQINETLLEHVPANFVIKAVANEAELYAFKEVFVTTYEVPDWAGQAWVDATVQIGIESSPWKIYVGWLDQKPVATNILFNGGGIASVYGVATIPSARGKGIGGAITLKPLLKARDMGYRYAGLFASEMGIHAYQRIGFKLTDARINRYLWRNIG